MQDISDFDWVEQCYFPEWADRPPAAGSLPEADRNSYLAGGYAEEFGHRVAFLSRQASSMSMEEDDRHWRVQIGCLHPGYPECPRPVDREPMPGGEGAGGAGRSSAHDSVGSYGAHRAEQPRSTTPAFRVVLVGQSQGGPRRHSWTLFREFRLRRTRLPLG